MSHQTWLEAPLDRWDHEVAIWDARSADLRRVRQKTAKELAAVIEERFDDLKSGLSGDEFRTALIPAMVHFLERCDPETEDRLAVLFDVLSPLDEH